MSDDVLASSYLVVKGIRQPYYGTKNPETGLYPVREAKVTQARQSRPTQLGPDEVLIKVSVQLPKAVFDPITPSALIVVPDELILDRHQIEVEATESNQSTKENA